MRQRANHKDVEGGNDLASAWESQMETLTALSDWLAASGLSKWIAGTAWAVPTLQSIHILAIGVILASLAMLDLRLAGLIGREQSLRDMTLRFYPWIWGALGVLVTDRKSVV